VGVPVGTGKKALTGRGGASKEQSVAAANAKFDIVCATHDEADAIGIALGYEYVKAK
jgi:Holliday junction resolvasome RuvABC endonuclease subunit